MAPPAERGRAITFIFLGWSLASVRRHADRGLARRHLRLAQRVLSRSPRSARSPRVWVLRDDARRRAAGGADARRLAARRFANPVLMAIVARHRAGRRRPVHAVLVLRALLQATSSARARDRGRACSSSGSASSALIGNVARSRATSTASAPTRAVGVALVADGALAAGLAARPPASSPMALVARALGARLLLVELGAAGAPGRRGAGAGAGADGAQHARRSTSARRPARRAAAG